MSISSVSNTPTPASHQARLEALEVLRIVATVAVVAIHTSAAVLLNTPQQAMGFAVAGALNQLSRFAVPAFVLITGVGLFYNYGQRQNISWRQYFARRLRGIGIPYLAWSLVYFLFYRAVEQDFSSMGPRLLMALATASSVYTFYYFIIVVPFYVLFPLMHPLSRSKWIGTIAVLAIAGNGFLVWFGFPHVKISLGPILSEVWPYGGNTPLWWMGPFFLGAWLASRWEAVTAWLRRFWIGLFALASVLLVWVLEEFQAYVEVGKLAYVSTHFRPSAYTYALVIMLAIIGLGAVLAARSTWATNLIRPLSKYSFAVYLVHPLVMHVTNKVLGLLNVGALTHFALNLALVLTLSYLVALLIDRVPGGGLLIGVQPPRG